MTLSQQILAIAETGAADPVWPEAFHQAVRALGYTSYSIERVHPHPTKPEISFDVNYGFYGEGCLDEHSIPFWVLDHHNLNQAMAQHIAWMGLVCAEQNIKDLQAQLTKAIQTRDEAKLTYNAHLVSMAADTFFPATKDAA